MKKSYLLSTVLVSSALLFGCSDKENTALMTEEAFTSIEQSYNKEGKYVIDSISEADITPSKANEIVVVSNSSDTSKIEIYSYDEEKEDWSAIYSDDSHNNYDGLENLKLISVLEKDELEHIVLGYSGGNTSTLNFKVLAYSEASDSVDVVLDKMLNEYSNSRVTFEGEQIAIHSDEDDEILELYSWNKNSYILQ